MLVLQRVEKGAEAWVAEAGPALVDGRTSSDDGLDGGEDLENLLHRRLASVVWGGACAVVRRCALVVCRQRVLVPGFLSVRARALILLSVRPRALIAPLVHIGLGRGAIAHGIGEGEDEREHEAVRRRLDERF